MTPRESKVRKEAEELAVQIVNHFSAVQQQMYYKTCERLMLAALTFYNGADRRHRTSEAGDELSDSIDEAVELLRSAERFSKEEIVGD